jgi:hypothetical protein
MRHFRVLFQNARLETIQKYSLIGPPDKISNLRLIKFHIPKDESKIEFELRQFCEFVQDWNHKYWVTYLLGGFGCMHQDFKNTNFCSCIKTQQNLKYVTEKQKYIDYWKLCNNYEQMKSNDPNIDSTITAEFNKQFLNNTYFVHYTYNKTWYSYNFQMLWLELRVFLDRLFKKLRIFN